MEWESAVSQVVSRNGKEAWRVMSYCGSPTVTLKNFETGEELHFGIYGLLAEGWKLMKMEQDGTH